MPLRKLVITLAVAACAAGCSSLDDRPALEPSPAGVAARPVTVPIPRAGYKPTDAEHPPPNRWSPGLDAGAVGEHLRRLLETRGTVSAPASSGAPVPKLEVTLEDATIRYVAQTGILPLKIAVTIILFPFDVPNYFVASDRFDLVVRARWRLLDPGGRALDEGVAVAHQTGSFGDLSRGWHFVGYLRVPGCLDAEDWGRIAARLVPGAEESVAEQLALACEKAIARTPAR